MEEIRCAIYTRKSTDEGLEKEFNTLEAQREVLADKFLLIGLGIAGILEWNGVMKAEKNEVAPLNESKIDELFSNFWAVAENFRHQYCGLHEIIEAEKNAYTPEPNGTLVTGEVIAKDVEKEKTSVHSTSANTPKQP